jgi:DNA-binding Xre family transcriptional regulator
MNHEEICKELAGELEDMARWLSGGELSPGQFRLLLNALEKRKLERHGMKLSSMTSIEGVVHFSLRFSDTDELCASMDVDPINGKISTQLACTSESRPLDQG